MPVKNDFKVLIVGDSKVGKTSLIECFKTVNNPSSTCISTPTVGICIHNMIIANKEGKNIHLTILDTSGQKKYFNDIRQQYNSYHGVIIVFDVNNRKSFDSAVFYWLESIKNALRNSNQWKCLMLGRKSSDKAIN